MVGVVAEAGMGKRRLCFEFLERCRAREYRRARDPIQALAPLTFQVATRMCGS